MVVLVPVYQPGRHLIRLVTELRQAVPGVRVVVVDDGSGPAYAEVLDRASGGGCTVLRHPVNRGKGAALKTGFRHIAEADPAAHAEADPAADPAGPDRHVVTADADGQHAAADILRVADRVRDTGRIVLGVRRFSGSVPLRSRFGNTLTRLLFRAATGSPVRDTQTGLRGYPYGLLGWLLAVPGERFEYEMNVLLHATRAGHPIEETEVATTYLSDPGASHFGSLADSARVYWPLLRYAARPR